MTAMVERPRIENQKAMRDARTRVQFCYICGKDLPARSDRAWKDNVIGEHVLPRVLHGPQPSDAAERWRVELDVHRECEATQKQEVDHQIKLLQEMHVKHPKDWPSRGHLRQLGLQEGTLFDLVNGAAAPTFSGIAPLLAGVWCSVRGFHAALYNEFLPLEILHVVMPPVPVLVSNPQGCSLEDAETQSWLARSVVENAISNDKWDGVSAWGSRVKFRCAWWQ